MQLSFEIDGSLPKPARRPLKQRRFNGQSKAAGIHLADPALPVER